MVSGVISVRTLRKIFAVFASFRRSGFQLLFLDQKLLNFLRECEFFGSKWCFWRFYSRDVHALGKRRDSSKRANFPGGLRGGFGGNLGFYFAFFGGGVGRFGAISRFSIGAEPVRRAVRARIVGRICKIGCRFRETWREYRYKEANSRRPKISPYDEFVGTSESSTGMIPP